MNEQTTVLVESVDGGTAGRSMWKAMDKRRIDELAGDRAVSACIVAGPGNTPARKRTFRTTRKR